VLLPFYPENAIYAFASRFRYVDKNAAILMIDHLVTVVSPRGQIDGHPAFPQRTEAQL
jgi:hypothetical protein